MTIDSEDRERARGVGHTIGLFINLSFLIGFCYTLYDLNVLTTFLISSSIIFGALSTAMLMTTGVLGLYYYVTKESE